MVMYYTKEGYIDVDKTLEKDRSTFIFMVGARGIGKTFGFLKYLIDKQIKFIYMRRTQTQIDMIKSDELNPFKALRIELGDAYSFMMKRVNKNITGVYRTVKDENGIEKPYGDPVAFMLALSTVSNIRGFDASDDPFAPSDRRDFDASSTLSTIMRITLSSSLPITDCISGPPSHTYT